MKKRWTIRSDYPGESPEICRLGSRLNVTPLTAGLLWNRGIRDYESAYHFLSHADSTFHDPYLLADMDKAVERVERALEVGERIAIYGDYDVDGVTSTSLLYLYLTSRGAKNLSYYIPARVDEGYGVNRNAIERLSAEGVTLLITVDTGVTAIEETKLARELGMDLVITDHHECREILPDAVAVVNPMRSDEANRYPFSPLAGVGVAFKLVTAMEIRRLGRDADYLSEICAKYVDLVAIGTISDVMPLLDENRLFVSMGLHQLSKNPRPAVSLLLEEANRRSGRSDAPKSVITSSVISYTVAPRINAAGRMDRADKAVTLFLSDDPEVIRAAASELCDINKMRQDEENHIVDEAVAMIEALPADPNRRVLVLASDHWNSGVIGIVASRITERYGMPSILITFDGEDGKGSGRSVKGLNLVEALADSSDLLVKFGGHELAAGLSVKRDHLDAFIARINRFALNKINDQTDLTPVLSVDFPVRAEDLTLVQADQLRILEPYGAGNPTPLFLLQNVKVSDITELAGKHTKLSVRANGLTFVALCFGSPRATLDLVCGDSVDLVFQLNVNEFRGNHSVQLIVKDFRTTGVQINPSDVGLAAEILAGGSFCESDGFLPCRDDFARIYLYLKHRSGQGRDKYISSREFLTAYPDIGYVKLHLILEVLAETGLLSLDGGSIASDLAIYTLSPVRQKIDLERSALYLKIKSAMKS
ncbi:MAG: single-stranded-DNA-specific exonuclease RecJ [Eubacteriales bacterium]